MSESEKIIAVTDTTFSMEVVESELPVLVDFWAEWCAPCKTLGLILEEVVEEFEGKIKFAKINVDENPEIPAKHMVRGLPTLLLFKNGEVEAMQIGMLAKPKLVAFLESNL